MALFSSRSSAARLRMRTEASVMPTARKGAPVRPSGTGLTSRHLTSPPSALCPDSCMSSAAAAWDWVLTGSTQPLFDAASGAATAAIRDDCLSSCSQHHEASCDKKAAEHSLWPCRRPAWQAQISKRLPLEEAAGSQRKDKDAAAQCCPRSPPSRDAASHVAE